jgi:hypothetical protein
MKFSVAAVIGAAAVAQAGYGNVSYTTEVVTALTTYCPYSTTLVNNGVTYTVTEVWRILRADREGSGGLDKADSEDRTSAQLRPVLRSSPRLVPPTSCSLS